LLKSSGGPSTGGASNADMLYNVQQSQKLMLLIRSYMTHGHMKADLDPLKLYETYSKDYPEYADKFKLPLSKYVTSFSQKVIVFCWRPFKKLSSPQV
jgi:2-oxoglutarate dehydrogenase complex dehydrogenase (E1) component-like enzyme